MMLEKLEEEVNAAIAKIPGDFSQFRIRFGIPKSSWDTYYVTFDGNCFFLSYLNERGNRDILSSTTGYDEIKYACLKLLAKHAEGQERAENKIWFEDQRRRSFQKQLEYMELADPKGAVKLKREFDTILEENPYDDFSCFAWECISFSQYFLKTYIKNLKGAERQKAKKILKRIALYKDECALRQLASSYLTLKGKHSTAIDGSHNFAEYMKMHYRKASKDAKIIYKKYLKVVKLLGEQKKEPIAFAKELIPEMRKFYRQLNGKLREQDACACERCFTQE